MTLRAKFIVAAAATTLLAGPAAADHAWNNYHWSKGTGQLTVPVGDNVDSRWDVYLDQAMAGGPRIDGSNGDGWNASSVIESPLVAGGTTAKRCRAAAGRIEVCNARYGRTGWLGIASISISGGHITSGITKLNDTYFDTASYNKPEWRMLVTCQEIGHDYGLGHTDETFDNPNDGTCMDYTNAPAGGGSYGPSNEYLNAHDFEQLEIIYAHSHQTTTDFGERKPGGGKPATPPGLEIGDTPAAWGRAIGVDGQGRPNLFEKADSGRKIITHVFWAIGEGPQGRQHED